ncbi:hypothetical protein [Stenotrophomonas rhizophila]|uniref:hypothetical protein n=1 Tax=Stenotrophomonas rhizophila TaxID=216778 RepID=UPI003AF63547
MIFSDEWYRSEWRRLGFHYELDEVSRRWNINGSAKGLHSFVAAIREYAADSENDWVSCHLNLGPHEYLEIGTWSSAIIDDHWIAGPLSELLSLATFIEKWIGASKVGDCVSVRPFFSPDSRYDVWLRLAPDDFDPSSLDTSLATPFS